MLSCPSRRNVREAHQIWSVLSPFRVSVTKGNWRKKQGISNNISFSREKVFFRYKDGAKHYSMGLSAFKKLAQEAGTIYKYGRIVLVDANAIDEYLELCREPASV